MLCVPVQQAIGQVGVGVDLTPSFTGSSKDGSKTAAIKDSFAYYLSDSFGLEYAQVRNLQKKGFGRIELIKMLLIANRADIDFDEIVKKRSTLTPLETIAREYDLDYRLIRTDAAEYKHEIENKINEHPITEKEPPEDKERN
ncbi:MAG: hypothetical protein GF384_07815 [Elusimicrobia bacterium]|nr:hypothetical protein [Elusimicrobiota bacterium]MBD3412550.1 hypothetical protein [Elusimicrobiota bacterium]